MRNYIGIDIKGARMWRGAKTATDRKMPNVGFLRTRIEFINALFAESEVSEIWITFPDPQLKTGGPRKLTCRFTPLLCPDCSGRGRRINLKTDRTPLRLYQRGAPPFGLPAKSRTGHLRHEASRRVLSV